MTDQEKNENMRVKMGPERIYMDLTLYEAASKGNIKLFDELLRADQAPNDQHECHIAIDVTKSFPPEASRASCLLGVTYAGDTALHVAVLFGQIELAEKICQVSIPLLTRANNKLETPLHYAAQVGNIKLVKHFIGLARQEGNDIDLHELLRKRNREGATALYHAVRHQQEEVVKELMAADPALASITDDQKMSPLYLATMLTSLPIVECLAQNLPLDVPGEAYSGPDGRTALHNAALSMTEDFVKMVDWWKPELRDATDNSGWTALHYAALGNNLAAAKMLLKKDRTLAYKADYCDLYPVHVAAKLGSLEVVIELFKQCPDSGELLDGRGKNFLHLAVQEKKEGIVRWVCKNSIDHEKAINAQDYEGNTPLHLAVKTRHSTVVCRLLASRRAHLNWVNKNELTPLDIAEEQMKDGFSDRQNPDYVILSALREVGCSRTRFWTDQLEIESYQEKDEEKEMKEMESCENMAKTMSIGSVLIASAAFAAAFTVYGLYIDKKDLYGNPQLKMVFEVFFLLDAYAFLCSIIATGLLVEAALTFLDLEYRKRYLLICTSLVMVAAKYFIVAFTTAAYVILVHVRKWLAILIYVMGAIAPMLIQPGQTPNMLVSRTVLRYRYLWPSDQWAPLLGNILYIVMVFAVLLGSLNHWRTDIFLALVIMFLVITTFQLLVDAVKERAMNPRIKIRSLFF